MLTKGNEWSMIGVECDLCKRLKQKDERWSAWHTNAGISGFTFDFCPDCEKNRDAECCELLGKTVSDHIKRVREYWDTHPEELARHQRETEEYRKTLDADGYPFGVARPWHKKVWNWFCRKIGYTMYDRHGRPTGRSRHA